MKSVEGINCISGKAVRLEFLKDLINKVKQIENPAQNLPFIGPGLIDLQINGIDGIDFNDTAIRPEDLLTATHYLLSKGVTTFFPTLITNADDNIHQLIQTIGEACQRYPLVNACVGGIHLEGPFISKVDGARGAHNLQYLKAPEWDWVRKCQEIAKGRVRLLTFSPELENAAEFIRQCRQHEILVAIGHSNANPEQIREAVSAGATLSTHLGNAVPLMLPRHPNLLWEQLAQDNLYASIIADGFHLPDAFLKVVIRTKGNQAFLVSDATCFSGMAAGVYQTHIGEEVILEKEGRLAMKKSPDLLAGATKSLLEDIQYLLDHNLASLADAWKMASTHVAHFLGNTCYGFVENQTADLVIYQINPGKKLKVVKVVKHGQGVFEA
ncbi:N-acetylglucosamine-6-phosphate deacetylase [Catalinimonas niigatensis]|uniref:N-acetylglucosamine-6-phosphate deacetylase n=1 Tax=Catalinimonas niigatensis TaxID=1397264 RepID=UPI002664F22B|nr:N-acetylglucosamine-6-phosphate deacetylase [Catalinimonas niigatensis]WPP50964.1 N-acetylglucosamine-6-phosphate deacetylase [Catalinimonas niigatensis]